MRSTWPVWTGLRLAAGAVHDERHWVYKLEGTPCKRCGTNIVLEEFGARKLYWCPGCQT